MRGAEVEYLLMPLCMRYSTQRDVEHLQSTMLEAAERKLSAIKQWMEKKQPQPAACKQTRMIRISGSGVMWL